MSMERYTILSLLSPVIERYQGYYGSALRVLARDENGEVGERMLFSEDDGDLKEYSVGDYFIR